MLLFIIERGVTINDSILMDLFELSEILRNTDIAATLVGYIRDVNCGDRGGSFLYRACQAGNATVAQLLLERGSFVRSGCRDRPRYCPLKVASE